MELDWLETFLAVIDSGGFTAASAHVHRSQSRVSAHIAGLERELGTRLIDRAHRPATLTPAGALFADHARRILAQIDEARAAVAMLHSQDEVSLAVLTVPYLGAALFAGVLAEMAGNQPDARVTLSEQASTLLGDQLNGFAAAVLPATAGEHLTVRFEHRALLWRERFRVVVAPGHELARNGNPVALTKLVQQQLILSGGNTGTEADVTGVLATRGLGLTGTTTVESPQTLVELARRGVGVGLESAVALEYADTHDMVVLDVDDSGLGRDVLVCWTDALLTTAAGRTLHSTMLAAPLPRGASTAG